MVHGQLAGSLDGAGQAPAPAGIATGGGGRPVYPGRECAPDGNRAEVECKSIPEARPGGSTGNGDRYFYATLLSSRSAENNSSSGAIVRPISAIRDQSCAEASFSFLASWRVASRKARRFSAAAV